MDKYIQGNKEAWEEAFDLKDKSYGIDIEKRLLSEDYAYFNEETAQILRKHDFKNKVIGQFCCNDGRELLSLVRTSGAKSGIGFDIAENMVAFANETAQKLNVPCKFVATNVLEIGEEYAQMFDAVIITIGATCWFKNLKDYFTVVSKCMKKDAVIIINETHPMVNMLACEGEDEYDKERPLNCVYSYFEHEWIGNSGMNYMVGKSYQSKTFTDYTHSMAEMVGGLCANGIVLTDMLELDYDISGGFSHLDHKGFPLSMILEGRKVR